MNILVCIKQVPGTSKVEVDPVTGVLKRDSADTKMNPYDLFALETALRIREEVGGTIKVISMGPPQAMDVIKEAFSMGADDGALVSDRKFGGADVLATSYTISQGVRKMGDFDLILCGKQTTDGDTAQVGPEMAEYLGIPHIANVIDIINVKENSMQLKMDMPNTVEIAEVKFPCLLTVEKDIFVPRLPSYLLQKQSKDRPVKIMTFEDMADQNLSKYGLVGSPTAVEKMFAPPEVEKQVYFDGDAKEKTKQLFDVLVNKKVI